MNALSASPERERGIVEGLRLASESVVKLATRADLVGEAKIAIVLRSLAQAIGETADQVESENRKAVQ